MTVVTYGMPWVIGCASIAEARAALAAGAVHLVTTSLALPDGGKPDAVFLALKGNQARELAPRLAAAGLQWVETDPERHAQTQQRIAASYAPVRLGRERKPVTPVSNEPLVQVETRH